MCSGQLLAQETYQESGEEGEVSDGEHKNHLAVFLGVTVEEDENAFSIGVDYERRVSRRFGIGALVDYASGDVRAFVVGLPVFIHATDRLRFIVAAGLEDSSHGTETLVRLGVDYEFELGRISLSPVINIDFVDRDEILVFGVNIGHSF